MLGLAAYAILWVSITAFVHYDLFVKVTILLLGLTLLPEGLTDIAQGLLMATGHIRWMALSSSVISVSQFAVGALVIWHDPRLQSLLVVLIVFSFLGCALNLGLARIPLRSIVSGGGSAGKLPDGISLQLWRQHLAVVPAFIAISAFSVLETQMDVALLSASRSIEEVGVYGAAKTIIASFAILSQAFRIAIYPRLTNLYQPPTLDHLQEVYRRLFRYLAAVAFPIAALIVLEAPHIVHLLYRSGFSQSTLPLQILSVSLLVGFIYIPATRLMIASHHERQLAWLLFVSFTVNFVANLVLIPLWGAQRERGGPRPFGFGLFRAVRSICRPESSADRDSGVLARVAICTAVLIAVILVVRRYSDILAILSGLAVYGALLIRLKSIDVHHLVAVIREYQAQAGKIRSKGAVGAARAAPLRVTKIQSRGLFNPIGVWTFGLNQGIYDLVILLSQLRKEISLMKRTLLGVMAILMMLSLVVLPASAQTISPWATGVDLQNLTDTETPYWLYFYKADGTLAYTYASTTNLAARGAANVYIPNLTNLPAGQYSVVVSSEQLVAAVASLNSYLPAIRSSAAVTSTLALRTRRTRWSSPWPTATIRPASGIRS